jgi:hypothetical protein
MKLIVWKNIDEGERMPWALLSFGRSSPGHAWYRALYLAAVFPFPVHRSFHRRRDLNRIEAGEFWPCFDVVFGFARRRWFFRPLFFLWPIEGHCEYRSVQEFQR